jgi:hypothetical protein
MAVALLLLYPFAFYLMGAVYADALFIVGALAAFLALEHDRPILAGLAALVATAARPVGTALVLGLWVLYLERKGVFGPRGARQRPRAADAGLLLAPMGMVAFCLFLWSRFGEPFAFFDVAGAPGWDQPPGAHTWFKVHWVKAMWNGPWTNGHFGHLSINAIATVVTAAFIPMVFRRLGWGYGVYVVIAVLRRRWRRRTSSAWAATPSPPSRASPWPPTCFSAGLGWRGRCWVSPVWGC